MSSINKNKKTYMATKYKSGLELKFATHLKSNNIPVRYELDRLPYIKHHTYTPDFKISDQIYIETKGLFSGSDRTKMLLTRQQHPGVHFILVFQEPNKYLSKKSTTTYADWCDKNGFLWTKIGDMSKLIKHITSIDAGALS